MTAPIIFSHPVARRQLLAEHVVVTFRSERSTGVTRWRPSRTASARHVVEVERLREAVPPCPDELRRYAGLSGFSSAEMWWGGIVDTHGLVPPDGALYRVSLVPSCPRCGQVLSGWAAEDGTLPLGHFSRGCGD